MDFLKQIIKNSGNEDATTVESGLDADVAGFLNTGAFAFNALVSGSLYGGIPGNKITALAGESSTGKTWFALSLVEQFLKDHPKGAVVYFDTEQAVTTEMFESRRIDGSRVAVFPVSTIEKFKHQSLKIVEQVLEQKEEDRIPMMFVLDSLGMLSTEKEVTDAADGKNVRDMTRAQGVRSTFRVLSVKLGKAGIPLVVTNHTYNVVGCLSGNVNILMEDGSQKNITNISIGDRVKTLAGSSSVTELFSYDVTETIEVELEDGTVFYATPNHKFMTRDGIWKPISDILEGEEIVSVQ
jgi:RecA/RadA recombinase